MALFRTYSAAIQGIDAHLIDVEVDMYPAGTNRDFVTVGMPDAAVKESRERIKSALLNSGFGYPSKSVTINWLPQMCEKKALVSICRWPLPSSAQWERSVKARTICSSANSRLTAASGLFEGHFPSRSARRERVFATWFCLSRMPPKPRLQKESGIWAQALGGSRSDSSTSQQSFSPTDAQH